MKVFILIDEDNIVRCVASEESNLHADKSHMGKYYIERQGTVGDEYDPNTEVWTSRPENYSQPSKDEFDEGKIQDEIKLLQRTEAIQSLKGKGELSQDFKDKDK